MLTDNNDSCTKHNTTLKISERFFGKNWREVRLVLHEDSTLSWYLSDSDPEGGILLKDAPEMIAAGQVFLLKGCICYKVIYIYILYMHT